MSSTTGVAAETQPLSGRFRVLLTAAVGSLLLFAAQPPLSWSLLAWIAPLPWLAIVTQRQLGEWRPNLQIWLAGVLYWLCTLYWIRLAHPATILGLVLLACILACYLLLFIRVARLGVIALGMPLWLVAPVAWVACEWLQAHLFSGFLMGAMSHTQIDNLKLVQIADIGGAYFVSMLMVFVASCTWQVILTLRDGDAPSVRQRSPAAIAGPAVLASIALAATWTYGDRRIEHLQSLDRAEPVRMALIQGSERAVWTTDEGRDRRVMDSYMRLSRSAVEEADPDLVVWPEGMFRTLLYSYDSEIAESGADLTAADEFARAAPADLGAATGQFYAPLITGIDRYHVGGPPQMATGGGRGQLYNSAVAVTLKGEIIGTYDKTHRVMFGEYVPGGDLWPGIYNYFPIARITPGVLPAAFQIDSVRYMPTICFETVVPHVVRGQLAEIGNGGSPPDVLVNLTNDSWFYDSSELRMHLTCTRFRAIECRTPTVVAANGGLSAHIDLTGELVKVSKPMTEQVLHVEVQPGAAESLYVRFGDALAIGCLLATVLIAIMAILRVRTNRSPTANRAIDNA